MQTNNIPTKTNSMDVADIIRESWQLINGIKFNCFVVGVLLPIFFSIAFGIVTVFFAMILTELTNVFFAIYFAVMLYCIWYTMVIYLMLGVRKALGLSATISETMTSCNAKFTKILLLFIGWLMIMGIFFLANLLIDIITKNASIGLTDLALLIICVILFTIALPFHIFTIPLVILKDISISSALKQSYQACFKFYFQILFCYGFMLLFIIPLSAIPFGIGLIWTFPMLGTMSGIFLRHAFLINIYQELKI